MPRINFTIDKLTKSIEERESGKSFATVVHLVSKADVRTLLKKNGWRFNWRVEFKEPRRQIFKLLVKGSSEIQGLISLEVMPDHQFVEMHLIESAPSNCGRRKHFLGVAGNLVAFACKMSFDFGFDGFVAFTAKTVLVDHYIDSLGARLLFGKNRLGIFTEEARNLVDLYYYSIPPYEG